MSVETVSVYFAMLTAVAQGAVLVALALFGLRGRIAVVGRASARLADLVAPKALGLAWLVAAVATFGSLYYSEVARFVPCRLCWYQRIAMYPLVVILGVGVLGKDVRVRTEVSILAIVGAAISLYHYQLERFPAQASASCDAAAPCTLVLVWKFHYISIPLMALSAFALIAVLMRVANAAAPDEPDSAPMSTGA